MQIASTTPPRPIAELLQAIDAGTYQYVVAIGSELEVDAGEAREALSRLKGVVTIAAHDGPLAKAAHIALPCCAWAEVDGTYVNKDGLAQRSERALSARGDARPGWELVARLARALGYAMDWKKLSDVHRAMAPEAFALVNDGDSALGRDGGSALGRDGGSAPKPPPPPGTEDSKPADKTEIRA
jgi:NADH-quinone oxidoreductase subunit G